MSNLCPICSDILLRHFYQSKIFWFCPRCNQEMPNFDLLKINTVKNNFLKQDEYLNDHQDTYHQNQDQKNTQLVTHQSMIVDLLITEDKNRLEVVNFILSQLNMIVVNAFTDTDQYIFCDHSQSKQLKIQNNKLQKTTKIDFLRDSEIILLNICQAILVSDSSILNNERFQGLKTNYLKLKFPVEKISCFLDLIKTLVIDFIYSITSDSAQNVHCLGSEVASYFETVITLMIKPE